MDRGIAAQRRGRSMDFCAQFNQGDLKVLYEHNRVERFISNQRMTAIMILFIAATILLSFFALRSNDSISAMDKCQELASFETCFLTLNR